MSLQYLVDHGLFEMLSLAIGILLIGLCSTCLQRKKDAEERRRSGPLAAFSQRADK